MTTTTTTAPASRRIAWPTVIWLGGLHVGALLAFVPAFFTWQALVVCLIVHWLAGGIGICLCYHRLLTHRSFVVRPHWLEYVLTVFGCCASEGGPIGWVADHRKHHAHSDEEADVHTPLRSFLWAHMMWFITPDPANVHCDEYFQRWAPDLYRDPVLRLLDKYFILIPLTEAALLYALGGMPYLVWGFFVGTVLVLHSTWLVNSATHVWGYRSYKTRDDSTNLWWVALITYGEGWHNNHHAIQSSARHGLAWYELDMTYWTLRLGQVFGLVHSLKLPKASRHVIVENYSEEVQPKPIFRIDESELVGASS